MNIYMWHTISGAPIKFRMKYIGMGRKKRKKKKGIYAVSKTSKPVTTSRWQGNIYKQNQIVEKNGINNKQ